LISNILSSLGVKPITLTHETITGSINALTICGDIGTSCIYASTIASGIVLRHFGSLNQPQILGITSLLIWTTIPVFVLYMFGLVYLTDLEEKVEGGSPAFYLLIRQLKKKPIAISTFLTTAVLMMMALTIPDFWLTGAISLLAAFGGLKILMPDLPQYFVWVPACIVAFWFFGPLMSKGIGKINTYFGPITLVWFILISLFSVIAITKNPDSLAAFNLSYGFSLIQSMPVMVTISLFGALVLIITGWEAAQLDRKDYLLHGVKGARTVLPIQIAFSINTVTNLLSVLAQCSFALQLAAGTQIFQGVHSNTIAKSFTVDHELPNLFFGSLPSQPIVLFMVCYAVIEVIIAATATTLGAQNLFAELHGLGLWFRMPRIFTSKTNKHEFYVKPICESLKWGCIALIIWAQTDEHLASAYGTSVICGMFVGSFLASQLAPYVISELNINETHKRWIKSCTTLFFGFFVIFLIPYLLGGLSKIAEGSWMTLLGAAIFYLILDSYRWGERRVSAVLSEQTVTIAELYQTYDVSPRTGILLVKPEGKEVNEENQAPVFLQKYVHKHGVIPEKLVCINIVIDTIANNDTVNRFSLKKITYSNHEIISIIAKYGWADKININDAMDYASEQIGKDLSENSIFITSKVYLESRRRTSWYRWLKYQVYKAIRTNFSQPFHEWVGLTNPDDVVKVNFATEI
jgi:KUP system potassium uptake protein